MVVVLLVLAPALMPTWVFGESPEVVGSLRLFGAALDFPSVPGLDSDDRDEIWAGVGRLLIDWEIAPDIAVEGNLFVDVTHAASSTVGGAFSTAGSFATPYRSTDLSWQLHEDGATSSQLGVDRLSMQWFAGAFDLKMGRFPINYSVTGVFTPNDFFAPFSSTAVNKVYKPGVDGVQLGRELGDLSGLEVSGVIGYTDGDRPDWKRSALLVRASTVKASFEWAALGGKLAERWIAGGSFQGDALGLGWRGEGHVSLPDRDGDGGASDDVSFRLASGVDKTYPWRNATIAAEIAFFSDGADRPADYVERASRFFPDDLPFLGRWYLGVSASGELNPIVRGSFLTLVNLNDGSGECVLSGLYSAADEADVVGGVIIPWGSTPASFDPSSPVASEFGHLPVTVFLEARLFF
jgi:hypothetical protein